MLILFFSDNYRLKFFPASPGNFLVDSNTGDMLAQPENAGEYTAKLIAVDDDGAEAVVRQWDFQATAAPKFGLVEGWIDPWTAAQQQTADSTEVSSSSSTMQYVVGNTYTVDRPSPTVPADLFVNAAAVGEISFKLVFKVRPSTRQPQAAPEAPLDDDGGVFLVDSSTGQIFAQPELEGDYAADLIAVDGSGAEVVVRNWAFHVQQPQTFRVSPGWSGTANNIEWELEVNSVFNATVQIGIPKEISGLRSPKRVVFEGASGTIVFALRVRNASCCCSSSSSSSQIDADAVAGADADACDSTLLDGDALPGKFFVDNTGEMLILPTVPGSYSVALVALDSAGQEAVVKEWQLDAAVDDLDLGDSYGPNSQGCGKGGTPVDAVKFDKAFTCECTGDGYFGQNCESQSLSKQISSKTAGGVAGGVFAGTILLVAALFAGKKYSAHREAMKPVDFHQKLAQMMASGEIRRRPSKKPSGSDGSPVLDSQGNRTDAVGEGASSLSIENRSIIKDHVTTSDDLLVPREIRRSDLTLLAEIGKGSFGEDYCFNYVLFLLSVVNDTDMVMTLQSLILGFIIESFSIFFFLLLLLSLSLSLSKPSQAKCGRER